MQVGKDNGSVVKLNKTPLVEGHWYEYDFGRDVYLKSAELPTSTFNGNTMTCNYYGEQWNSCTMTKTK